MNPQEYLTALQALIDEALKRFDAVHPELTMRLSEVVNQLIGQLMRDSAGNILPSELNMSVINSLDSLIRSLLASPQTKQAIAEIIKGIDDATLQTNAFFASTPGFIGSAQAFNLLKRNAIDAVVQNLSQQPALTAISGPIRETLISNVTNGGSYEQLTEVLRTQINGSAELSGVLERHFKQISKDSIQQFNRGYTNMIAKDLNLSFYLYDGGLQTTSRPFCEHRAGNFYHKEEIQGWATQNWAGKMPTTNTQTIFVNAGGYNCNHQFIPMDAIAVPRADLERAKRKGYITDEEYQRAVGA